MGLNLLGLGFSFGAKDNGLAAKQKEVSSGFASIASEVERMGSKTDKLIGLSRLSTFIQSLSMARLNDIAGGIDKLANGGQNLTTSLEATITASTKTAKSMATNYGVASQHMSKFTSTAVGMSVALNIGADKATEATYQHTLATKELASVGLKSATDLAKFAEVSGVSASDVTQIFRKAGQQFGLTGDQLKQLAGAALQSGTEIGDIGGQFKQLPAILDLVQRRAAVLGKKFDPKQMADFASQTLSLGGAFYKMGQSADSARELATGFAEKMVESGEDFAGMFAGTKTDLNGFLVGIGIAQGDINKAFEAMKQGPGEFVTGMAEMVLRARKDGRLTADSMNQLRARLTDTFGAKQSSAMVDFFTRVDDAQLQAMKTTAKTTGDLGKFAQQGFSTGRTLAENFELMQNSFIMSFRNIGRSAAVDFVDKTGKEFKVFNKQMDAIVKEGGPLGALVQKFSEMHQIGALALLPETLRPMAAVLGTMTKEAIPLIGVLGSLGLRFSHLTNPLTLAVVGFGALAWSMKAAESNALKADKGLQSARKTLVSMEDQQARLAKQGRSSLKLDEQIAAQKEKIAGIEEKIIASAKEKNRKQIARVARAVVEKVGAFFAALPEIFRGVWNTVEEMWPDIGPPILRALQRAWNWVIGTALPFLFDFAKGIWGGFIDGNEAASGSVASKVGSSVGATLRKAFVFALKFVRDYLVTWWDKMGDIWGDSTTSFTEKIKATLQNSLGIIIALFAIARFTPIFSIIGSLISILTALVPILLSIGSAIFAVIGPVGLAVAAIAALVAGFLFFPEATGKAIDAVGGFLRKALAWITEKAIDIGLLFITYVVLGPLYAIAALGPKIFDALGKALNGLVDLLVNAVLGVLDGIENWLVKKFPESAGTISAVFQAIKAVVFAAGEVIKFVINAVIFAFQILWKVVGGILKALWWAFDTLIITPLGWIWTLITKIGEGFAWLFGKLAGLAESIGSALSSVGSFLGGIGRKIASLMPGLSGLTDAIKGTGEAASKGAKTNADFYKQFSKESMAARMEEAQRAANKATYEQERARLDAIHMKDLEARRATFIQVQVTSENAAAMMQKASDAHAKGIKDNITLIDSQARAASLIAFPQMEKEILGVAEAFKKADIEMAKAAASKDADAFKKASEAYTELSTKALEAHGVGAQFFADMRRLQMEEFTMRVDLQGKMSVGEQKSYQESLDRIFNRYLVERQEAEKTMNQLGRLYSTNTEKLTAQLQEQTKNYAIGSTEWVKAYQDYDVKRRDLEKKFASDNAQVQADINLINAKATAQKLLMEQFMGVETAKIYKQLADGMLTIEQDKFAAMSALQQRFVADTTNVLKTVHPMMRDAAARAQAELNRAYFEQLRELTAREFANADERKNAFEALEKWKGDKLQEFTNKVIEQEKVIAAGGTAAVKGMEDQFGKFTEGFTKKANDAALKAGSAVGTVQKELGVTADEALNNLKNLAAIDPKKFASDLKVIKAVYIEFAKTAQEQSILMLETSGKAFDEFNAKAIDNWKKVREGTKLFTKDEAKLFSDLTETIIKKFGDAWMKVLGFTTTALEAIEKDTSRAIANLKQIEAAMLSARSNKIEVAGATVQQDVKVDSTKSELGNIFQATHHPEWYEQDFKAKVNDILMTLNAVLVALTTTTRGGQTTQGPLASRQAAQKLQQGGIGMGDAYARPGALK